MTSDDPEDPDNRNDTSPGSISDHPTMFDDRDAVFGSDGALERIGGYQVLGFIGAGGMGTVYEARQERPSRMVALKVIKASGLSRSILRRFEQESQLLGRLQHPGIAQVYEAGTAKDERGNDLPFFAMELIRGLELRRYAAERNLGTRERLDLIARICDAVGHAHQRGVIHRDLKPANILVEESGQPRVLDFGVARALDGDEHQTTMHTDIGQVMGTLAYMSPEQASGHSADLDTRSDVYALGVIAYELLAGRMPYTVDRRVIHEAVRVIQHKEPTPLSSVNRTLRGDVETMVAKALEKERARRYESADAFASDIRHYLQDEPIAARPASVWYQAKKFTQRNRGLVAGLGTAILLLAIGLVVALTQAAHVREERDRAQTVVDFMDGMLHSIGPSVALGRDSAMLKGIMDAAAARIKNGELKDAPAAELKLRVTIGDVYRELSLFPQATEMLEPVPALARSLNSGDSDETADALLTLGALEKDQDKFDRAEPLMVEALDMLRRLHKGDHQEVASALRDLSAVRADQGKDEEAVRLLNETIAMLRRLHPSGGDLLLATAINDLGQSYNQIGRPKDAQSAYREALAMHRALNPGDHPETATTMNNLAVALKDTGDLDEAIEMFRETLAMNRRLLPKDHQYVAGGLNNLASTLKDAGKTEEALPLLRESLEMRRRLFPGDHSMVASGLNNLALLLQDQGEVEEAERMFRESLAMRRRIYKGDHVSIAIDLNNLALLLRGKKDYAASLAMFGDAIAMYERTNGKDFWRVGYGRQGRGVTYQRMGRFKEGEVDLIEAERVYSKAKGNISAERQATMVKALAEFYEAWVKADPRGGHEANAAEWRAKVTPKE